MESVIGDQYIARRSKPVPIVPDRSFGLSPAGERLARRPGLRARLFRRAERAVQARSPVAEAPVPAPVRKPRAIDRSYIAPVLAGAGAVLLLAAVVAAGASESSVDYTGFSLPEDGILASTLLNAISPAVADGSDDEPMAPLPLTLSLSTYKVAKNDTLEAVSRRFGVRLDTLISINGIKDVRRIIAGTTLKIPNIDGIAHTVRKGESLSSIAESADATILDLIDANDLSSQTIVPGQVLFIPGARLSSTELKRALGQLVIWPVAGRISSYFGYRPNPFTGVRQFHSGLDLVVPENSKVGAAMDGRVAETGYSAIFGNFVILSHADGYQTLYAHLNKILVKNGARITQGTSLGLVGSTGYSTGPHLHFGVFKNGKAIDPRKLLTGR